MATARHCRMVLVGDWASGPFQGEIWQTGISFVASDTVEDFQEGIRAPLPFLTVEEEGDFEDDPSYRIDWAWQGLANMDRTRQKQLADAGIGMWGNLKTLVPAASRLTEVRIGAWSIDGKMINGNNIFTLKTPVTGTGNNASYLPAECGVVASLLTGARGPGGRGRMYLPLCGITTAAGLLSTANRSTVATQVSNLVLELHDTKSAAAVVNKARQTFSTVTSIAVGDGIDIQRRRANRVNEDYLTLPTNWA